VTDSPLAPKRPFDFSTYLARVQDGPCFVCAILEGNPDYPAIMVYEDNETVAFLARYPTLLGYCIVAPRRHIEHVIGDLEVDEYLRLQTVVHRVARAISAAVPTERIYLLSLGSQQGNAHVHWHIAPLPPGVPYEQQQFHAVMAENGILDLDAAEQAALADSIRNNLSRVGTSGP
jgi:diadenosine tetraphosphate (Ap4A) HIT family hydrolase